MESLNVSPEHLHKSADHLDLHLGNHRTAHNAANSQIEESLTGWVDSSGKALQGKLSALSAVSTHITNELTALRDGFDMCGHEFSVTDEQRASDIFRTMGSL